MTFKSFIYKVMQTKPFHKMPDDRYLKMAYYLLMGQRLNLNNPITFNEKLQWLKLYDRNPIYSEMVDKYSAKKYAEQIIGKEYIIPTLGVWDRFEDINFDELPEQFVLKCTHDSAGLYIVKNKKEFDYENAKKKLSKCLQSNYYYVCREWPYKDVKPRIIAEEYISDNQNSSLIDYKVHNFSGEPKFILVCTDRFSKEGIHEDFYDLDWNLMDLHRPSHQNSINQVKKPCNFDLLLELSHKLSTNIPFLRTDFYEVNGKLLLGELTFFPAGGMDRFEPELWDNILGDWIKLPTKEIGV